MLNVTLATMGEYRCKADFKFQFGKIPIAHFTVQDFIQQTI